MALWLEDWCTDPCGAPAAPRIPVYVGAGGEGGAALGGARAQEPEREHARGARLGGAP